MVQSRPEFQCGVVLIVGVGRSGTSLLHSILNAHSKLVFPPETGVLRRYVASSRLMKAYRVDGAAGMARLLGNDSRVARMRIDVHRAAKAVRPQQALRPDVQFYLSILSEYAGDRTVHLLGDKDPRCVEELQFIRRHIPDTFVIHMLRDPRDVLASKKQAEWSHKYGSMRNAIVATLQLQSATMLGRRLFGKNFIEIRYEDLLSAPERTLQDLCEAIGIAYEPGMLNFQRSAHKLVAEDEIAWKRETLGPLLRGNAGKWESCLSYSDVVLIESALAGPFLTYGYAPLAPRSWKSMRFWLSFAAGKLIAAFGTTAVWLRSLVGRLRHVRSDYSRARSGQR